MGYFAEDHSHDECLVALFVAPAPHITSHLDQVSARSSSPSLELVSSTSTDDGTEFALEIIGSRDASCNYLALPSLLSQGHSQDPFDFIFYVFPDVSSNRISRQNRTSRIRGKQNATTPPSSLPLQSHSFPRKSTDSSSLPVLDNPESFWKRLPLLNKFVVSISSTPWRIASII